MPDVVLKTRNLSKRFNRVAAVNEVDLSVNQGEVFGFLGPNGAGKTTTIGMILGLIHPTAGQVEVFGERVTPGHTRPLRRVGSLVGAPGMVPHLSGRDNLSLLAGLPPKANKERVEEVLKQVGLTEAANRAFQNYSTGMKQRLGLAAALLHRPSLLILDEPTNGLDPAGMREVRELLRALAAEGITVFLSSHLLHEVEQVCDRVAVLKQGHVVAQGTVAQLIGQQDVVKARVPSPAQAAGVLRTLAGVTRVEPNGTYVRVSGVPSEAVIVHLVNNGIVPSEVLRGESDLESIFLELTKETA
ncbi:MAG: ABC transporter ATP-binding protein [Chloroflexota bacterium]